VPPQIIRLLIEHYTQRGEVVLDGFCGSGMTGVAARESGRNAILCDLSPIATFISYINCTRFPYQEVIQTLQDIIEESKNTLGYMYETKENGRLMSVNYYVWCDVFICPECLYEFPFFPYAVNHTGKKVKTKKTFKCPQCNCQSNVRSIERVITFNNQKKKKLVWVNAGAGRNRINREATEFDLLLAEKIESREVLNWYPRDPVDPSGYSAKLAQLGQKAITDVSRFLSKRNLIIFADLWSRVAKIEKNEIRHLCQATLTSIFTVISERQGYFGGGGGMSGNLYMPIVRMEKNIYDSLERKFSKLTKAEKRKSHFAGDVRVTTQSTTNLQINDNSIDYIYTDPPFGDNIIYSEMNLLLEGWIKVKTNNEPEAVIDSSKRKSFDDYQKLMLSCFREYYRVLKPGRWMTVEFHNTKASVWNLIQNTISTSGFVIAQIGTLDKGSTTILADIRPGAAKYDLIISAYKPDTKFETQFLQEAGTEEGAWEFIRQHLGQLPVVVANEGVIETLSERQDYLLFDRMVAFHIQRGATVPLSASQFYAGLRQRFIERDSMFFLPDQAPAYDKARLEAASVAQLSLFVTDEKSSIQWLRQQLAPEFGGFPQTYQEIQPQFLKQLHQLKHEALPELSDILEQNFLQDDQGHWYMPDPNKASDLEKLRQKALLREFNDYRTGKKKLRQFRTEAIRAGFAHAWANKEYAAIVQVAERLPDKVLQEDPDLLMYYDNACLMIG
jgi:DNA modification methylase